MALPTQQRLKSAKDFRSTFRAQPTFKQGKLLLKARASKGKSSRFGIVVGKTVSKKAVERNRIKRLLREALATKQATMKNSYDIVLVALAGCDLQNLKEANEHVEKLFAKASL